MLAKAQYWKTLLAGGNLLFVTDSVCSAFSLHYIFVFVIFRDFLPRGSGIVTRRPLILQLINSNQGIFISNL